MALFGRGAVPVCLVLLLVSLPVCDAQTTPQGEPNPDMQTHTVSKNLKEIVKQLDHQIQVLNQNNLTHEHEISEKQDSILTVEMTAVTGSSVKEKSTPSSLTTQETPFSSSYSLLVGDKLNKTFLNILTDSPVTHDKVKGAGTEEDKKKRTLLPDLKQDNNAGNNDGKSVRATNISVRFHSSDNSSKTQIDIYNLKEAREIPEVHIVVSKINNQGIKIDSVVLKDNGLQVIVNSSVDKKRKRIPEKGRRKGLIKWDHGITRRNTPEGSLKNSPVTAFELLKDSQIEIPTNPSLFSEESDPKEEDSSQSMRQEPETSVNNVENILENLREENDKPNEKIESSLMENILQELKKYSGNHLTEEESDSTEEESTVMMEPPPAESHTKEFTVEPQLSQPPKSTPLPNLRIDEANEDIKDAKRFEFFEKYEGIQDKKRAKAADLKDLLKHIVIACVAVTGLILAVIVLVHIYTSLFVNKQQDQVARNGSICKEDETDPNEITGAEEKESHLPEDDTADIESQNKNNNCLSSPPAIFLSRACEDVIKPLEIQTAETVFSLYALERETEGKTPLAEPFNAKCEDINVESRTFKSYHICNNQEQHTQPEGHDYRGLQHKDTAPYREKSKCKKSSRHRSKPTEPKRTRAHSSSKHRCYSDSSWDSESSPDVSTVLDKKENSSKSRLYTGSECVCIQHLKGCSSRDSYSYSD